MAAACTSCGHRHVCAPAKLAPHRPPANVELTIWACTVVVTQVFVGLRFFSAINRIQHTAQPSDPIFVLYLLHSIASPLQVRLSRPAPPREHPVSHASLPPLCAPGWQGFANAMVYGFTAKVRQQYKRALCPRRETDVENPLRMLSSSQREFTGSSQLKPPSVDSQSTINGVHNARTKSSRTTSTGSRN